LRVFDSLAAAVREEGAAALVSVTGAEGSAPRDGGARMVVRPSGAFSGTIGGGALEWEAMRHARAALARGRGPAERRVFALGPQLGQCCGGRVDLLLETFDARDAPELARLAAAEPFRAHAWTGPDGRIAREIAEDGEEVFGEAATPVLLFGAGHVGRALTLALAPLPFRVRWIDSRPEAFPRFSPGNATLVESADPPAEIAGAPEGALIVVMTHSHPLDLAIVSAALAAQRFAYVGLIGSATKRARFLSQMRSAGLSETVLARLTCPIGVAGISGKAPAVIAAAVAAQMLQTAEATLSRSA
jgi:xanthine dehydrogenase accessory factor